MNELEELKLRVTKLKSRENFDKNYAAKGGADKLEELVLAGKTQRQVGDYFGFSPQQAAYSYNVLFGKWPHGPGKR